MIEDEKEVNDLGEIYSTLRQDAKAIIYDLKGGVVMWREAASGSAACAGFILILVLTFFRYTPPGTSIEGWAYVIAASALAVMMAVISAIGFRRYFVLRKKYAPLFRKSKQTLEQQKFFCRRRISKEPSSTWRRSTRRGEELRVWLSTILQATKKICEGGSKNCVVSGAS